MNDDSIAQPGTPPNLPDPADPADPVGSTTLSDILNRLLRDPLSLIHRFEGPGQPGGLSTKLAIIAVLSLAVFGVVVGTFSAGTQLWAAPLKIIGGLFFSGLICLPSLYIFSCLGGLDAKFRTVAGLLCAMLALAALLLVGFAPVVWLFSVSSNSLAFMGFLVTLLWLLCAGFGLLLVSRAGRALGMKGSGHLLIWCGVFLLVTLQMPTTLRPIIGKSDRLLHLEEKRFFLNYWGEQMNAEARATRSAAEE